MPATGSGGFSGSFSGRVRVSREQSFYLVMFGSQAYQHKDLSDSQGSTV